MPHAHDSFVLRNICAVAGISFALHLNLPWMESKTPKSSSADYDVFLREGEVGMYWRHTERGVVISDEGLLWSIEGEQRRTKFSEIESIHLMSAHMPKSGNVYTCHIRFQQGPPLSLYSTDDYGRPDETHETAYRYAMLDLHARLAKAALPQIRYQAGMTGGRHGFLLATLIVATLLFGVLPVGIFLFLETSWHTLGIVAAGIGLIWPLWSQWNNNHPRGYAPDDLPYDLIPE